MLPKLLLFLKSTHNSPLQKHSLLFFPFQKIYIFALKTVSNDEIKRVRSIFLLDKSPEYSVCFETRSRQINFKTIEYIMQDLNR